MYLEQPADEIAITFCKIRYPLQMVVHVAEERQYLVRDLRKLSVRHPVENLHLARRDALEPCDASPQVHDLAEDRVGAALHVKNAFLHPVDLLVKVVDDRHIKVDKLVENVVQQVCRASLDDKRTRS